MSGASTNLIPVLQQVLEALKQDPYPHVPTPPPCKKRASVAIIIRFRPKYEPIPAASASVAHIDPPQSYPTNHTDFFAQEWVSESQPEVLFIKRAGRPGDRWSGHIALPGGKRDPEDDSDVTAAIRETREEVGLDLSAPDCLYAGNLPERIIATTWGREALMVLCPYIFILTGKNAPPVQPQPTEVASAHWIPLRALLSPNLRTREYVDTASRMAKQGGPIAQFLLRAIVGKMVFSAVQLAPSESINASSIEGFLPSQPESRLYEFLAGAVGVTPRTIDTTHQRPLLLWGLTLGVMADFLDMLPPYNAVRLWRYPTFTPPDLRLFVYVFTHNLRQNNAGDLSAGTWPYDAKPANQTAVDATTAAVTVTKAESTKIAGSGVRTERDDEVGIGGLGVGSNPKHAVGRLLAGYYERVNYAIAAFVLYRTVLGAGAGWWLFKLWKRRRAA